MTKKELAEVEGFSWGGALHGGQYWRVEDGTWAFDGPVSLGPREVREARMGIRWRGRGATDADALQAFNHLEKREVAITVRPRTK